jgi:hypothetical protein
VLVFGSSEGDDGGVGDVEVVDRHVNMHLLRLVLGGPVGRCVALDLLEPDRVAVIRADLSPVGLSLN